MKKIHRNIEVTSGGGTKTLKIADLNSYYHVAGADVTLSSSFTLQTDSNLLGHIIEIYWSQKVTLNSNTITLFGKAITRTILDDVLIRAIYNGTTWDVWVIDDIDISGLQSDPVLLPDYIQVSNGTGGFTYVPDITINETTGVSFGANADITALSFVVGDNNEADSPVIIHGSTNVIATGCSAQVMGDLNTINGDDTITIGSSLTNNSYKEIDLGFFNEDISGTADSWVTTDVLFQIGNGADEDNLNSTLVMLKNGQTTVDAVWTFGAGISIPNNIIEVSGSSYTYNPTDDLSEVILAVSYTVSGAVAISLDANVINKNTRIIIKDTGGNATANNITITPASGTIDGDASLVLSTDYDSVTLFTDGTNFFIV